MPLKPIPREVSKWLQSLDLSYKVTNPRRDFANGFLVAEILSRNQNIKIEMSSFVYGSSMEARKSNWHCLKLLNKKNKWLPIAEKLADDIMNEAPNVAYNFLIDLYHFFNNKKPFLLNQPDEAQIFEKYNREVQRYMRPTAALLVKNKEIHRIQQKLVQSEYLRREPYIEKGLRFKPTTQPDAPLVELYHLGRKPVLEELIYRHKKNLAEEREVFKQREDRFDPPVLKKKDLRTMDNLNESRIPKKDGDDSKFVDMEIANNEMVSF